MIRDTPSFVTHITCFSFLILLSFTVQVEFKADRFYQSVMLYKMGSETTDQVGDRVKRLLNENNDSLLADFIESENMGEQAEAIKNISEYVSQLTRVGKGHGVWHFDRMVQPKMSSDIWC